MKKHVIICLAVAVALLGGAVAIALLTPRDDPAPEKAEEQVVEREEVIEEAPEVIEEPEEAPEEEPEDPGEPVTMAEAPVLTSATESGLTVTAPDAFLSSQQLADVEACIDAIEAGGNTVSVSLTDLSTRRGIWYDTDRLRYPASSIKAAYCIYLFETRDGAGGKSETVEDCLVNSSNEAYNELAETFGFSPWSAWLKSHGAPQTATVAATYTYPDTTAAELSSIWEEIYRYGTSGEAGSAELAGYLARTNSSPIGAELRDTCEVWSKPGWFPLDDNNIPATNDAGVVFSDTGAYVLVIMTDISSDLDALRPLVRALDAAHETMCGGAIAYYE